jgi:hypothetical protein
MTNGFEEISSGLFSFLSLYLSKYKESTTFIEGCCDALKLTIKDSELFLSNDALEVFAPKKYAKFIKIKNSKISF